MNNNPEFLIDIAPDEQQKSWAVRITFYPYASRADAQAMADELAKFYGTGGKAKVARVQ